MPDFYKCCRGCERRHIGCHADCKDYNGARKNAAVYNAKRREERRGYIEAAGMLEANLQRMGVRIKQK